ncbi:MAG: SDR family oxidoreductase [Phycisphaerales bacterium]
MSPRGKVLLTGATGYIGGRLAPLLLKRGWSIVCLVRDARKLDSAQWAWRDDVRIVEGDASDTATVREALDGCDAAYYLIHSMETGSDSFAERDRQLAQSFADAAEQSDLSRVVYLGGLGEERDEAGRSLSEHLRSRREIEDVLRSSGVPTTVFRAAIILGSGSASYEILRYLVERLPVMVTPRWVYTESQPISVIDVLGYLTDCLDLPATAGETIEIGGPEVLTYRELMSEMRRALGLPKRLVIPVPVLTPKLSSLWIGLVTPVSPAIARPLAEGLRNRVVVQSDSAQRLMPRETISPAVAIDRALERYRDHTVPTRWSMAGRMPGDPDWAGGRVFIDRRSVRVRASADAVFAAVCRVGGGNGWYAANVLWKLRGLMDQLIGGPGTKRGRRHPETVGYGEALDFWRVTDIDRPHRLELRAEMKLPGVAELAFDITPRDDETTELVMCARFRPKGLLGLAYWYSVLPFHAFVFRGMLGGMRRMAERIERGDHQAPAEA